MSVIRYAYSSSNVVKGSDEKVLKDFLFNLANNGIINGLPSLPINIQYDSLSTSTIGMDFFVRSFEHHVVEKSGTLRGCFEENIDGVFVILFCSYPYFN